MTRIFFGAAPILQIMHGSIVIHVNDVAGLICIPCIVFLFFLFLLRDDVSCFFFFEPQKLKTLDIPERGFFGEGEEEEEEEGIGASLFVANGLRMYSIVSRLMSESSKSSGRFHCTCCVLECS